MSALDDLKVGDIFTVSHAIEVDILLNISIQQNTRIAELEKDNTHLIKSNTEIANWNLGQFERIKELEALTTWQPIETAQKDGTMLRLYDPTYRHQGDGYHFSDLGIWVSQAVEIHPTHWMPLPKPPEEK